MKDPTSRQEQFGFVLVYVPSRWSPVGHRGSGLLASLVLVSLGSRVLGEIGNRLASLTESI